MTLPRLYHEWEYLQNTTDTSKWTLLDVKTWLEQWESEELREIVVEYALFQWAREEKKQKAATTTTKATIPDTKIINFPVLETLADGDFMSSALPAQFNYPFIQPVKKGGLRADAAVFVPPISTTTKKKEAPSHKLAKLHINQVNKGVAITKDVPVKSRVKNAETRLKAFGRSYTQLFEAAEVFERRASRIRLVAMIIEKKRGTNIVGIQKLVDNAVKYEEKARESQAQGEQNKVLICGHKLQMKAQKEAEKKAKKEAAENKVVGEELAAEELEVNRYLAQLVGLVI